MVFMSRTRKKIEKEIKTGLRAKKNINLIADKKIDLLKDKIDMKARRLKR